MPESKPTSFDLYKYLDWLMDQLPEEHRTESMRERLFEQIVELIARTLNNLIMPMEWAQIIDDPELSEDEIINRIDEYVKHNPEIETKINEELEFFASLILKSAQVKT